MTDGCLDIATMKSVLTSFSASPTHFYVKEDAETLKKVASDSEATALASIVFPLPGGPNENRPFSSYLTSLPFPLSAPPTMSGGRSADPQPHQWPNGGEFLLSILRNPTNPRRRRLPSHPHNDNSYNNNPPSAQHLPFAVHPVPLDPSVGTVGPAINPADVHDGLSSPSQPTHPHLIYPHNFASRPAVPKPNQQFVLTSGDFKGVDLGGVGFVDIRLPHQFQQRDLSVESLGFGLADGISYGLIVLGSVR